MNTRSAMASVHAHARNEAFRKSADNVVNKLCAHPETPVRVSTKLARHILIMFEILTARGKLYSTQVRNIGAGVKELYLKEVR